MQSTSRPAVTLASRVIALILFAFVTGIYEHLCATPGLVILQELPKTLSQFLERLWLIIPNLLRLAPVETVVDTVSDTVYTGYTCI